MDGRVKLRIDKMSLDELLDYFKECREGMGQADDASDFKLASKYDSKVAKIGDEITRRNAHESIVPLLDPRNSAYVRQGAATELAMRGPKAHRRKALLVLQEFAKLNGARSLNALMAIDILKTKCRDEGYPLD